MTISRTLKSQHDMTAMMMFDVAVFWWSLRAIPLFNNNNKILSCFVHTTHLNIKKTYGLYIQAGLRVCNNIVAHAWNSCVCANMIKSKRLYFLFRFCICHFWHGESFIVQNNVSTIRRKNVGTFKTPICLYFPQ